MREHAPTHEETFMTAMRETRDGNAIAPAAATALWITLIAALCVGGSTVFACAAPFAAIAALAAAKMERISGLALVVVAWIANQAVGFWLLDYPHTATTYAWGVAIGLGTVIGFAAGRSIVEAGKPPLLSLVLAFVTAFVWYQTALYAASFALGGSDYAFSGEIVWYVFKVNVASFAALLLLHRAAVALTLLRPIAASAPANI
jgi:hypothetical protein